MVGKSTCQAKVFHNTEELGAIMSDAVTVTVRYVFKPGMEVIGRQLLSEFSALNRPQPGCKEIILHRDNKNPASFLAISKWESMEQFMDLLNQPHVKEFAAKGKNMLAKPFEVEIWSVFDGAPEE